MATHVEEKPLAPSSTILFGNLGITKLKDAPKSAQSYWMLIARVALPLLFPKFTKSTNIPFTFSPHSPNPPAPPSS